ncbi:hypothetical protein AZE42_13551, partial [Rhizopogon vesiculosus]
MKSSVHH